MAKDTSRKQKCIRCVVHIHLVKVDWQDSDNVSVILGGPSVFVRACVLGQLQHSHLHTPTFPVSLHQTLMFDRVLTNCSDPSLFKEVIRGEHIKFELIQITTDFKGGKILARFDIPAHKFLFPDSPGGEKPHVQQVVLDKSRKYQHPPRLSYTCSTSLSEVTVQSPIDSLCEETYKVKYISSKPTLTTPTSSQPVSHDDDRRSHDEEYTRLKLHSLLESYLEPSKTGPDVKKPPYRVKFKPPVPKFPEPKMFSQLSYSPTHHPSTPPPHSHLYQSTTTRVGPHEWEACPRRSPKRQRSYSAPTSPARRVRVSRRSHATSEGIRPLSADLDRSLALSDLDDSPTDEVVDGRPPFVVRHIDPHLMERRDFCGCSQTQATDVPSRVSSGCSSGGAFRQSPLRRGRAADGVELEGDMPAYLNDNLRMSNEDYVPSGRLSSRVHTPSLKYRPHSVHFTTPPHTGTPTQVHSAHSTTPSHMSTSPPVRFTTPLHTDTPTQVHSAHSTTPSHMSTPPPVRFTTPLHTDTPTQVHSAHRSSYPSPHGRNRDIVAKYLVSHPGNVRSGVDSPGRVIEEKIERLKTECCDCKHDADSLGEDDLSEDLDRLRASLQAERDEYLSHTARLMPQDNVTVKIGPRDYWSRRMSEFTGKKHRLLFDETLEKIYNRLYTDASHSV